MSIDRLFNTEPDAKEVIKKKRDLPGYGDSNR